MVGNGSFPANISACKDWLDMAHWGVAKINQLSKPLHTVHACTVMEENSSEMIVYLKRSFEGLLFRAVPILIAASFVRHVHLTCEINAKGKHSKVSLNFFNIQSLLSIIIPVSSCSQETNTNQWVWGDWNSRFQGLFWPGSHSRKYDVNIRNMRMIWFCSKDLWGWSLYIPDCI